MTWAPCLKIFIIIIKTIDAERAKKLVKLATRVANLSLQVWLHITVCEKGFASGNPIALSCVLKALVNINAL